MHTLDKVLRNKLENTITKAREVAEEAARNALEQLGVEQSAAFGYLTEEQRKLRIKLRAHGRQLGDAQDSNRGTQEIGRLIEEVAYEHWHRMLFARFLAENQLLMFYEGNDIDNAVAVTLDECEEMAPEMGCSNRWELASRLAAKMLPQIFRLESPVFELNFSLEKKRELETLLSSLKSEVFTASDSIGWVYQFWQTKKKKEVNDSQVKIGTKELPAVTQLFTEPYMVHFLLDNSLGAWWAKRRLTEDDLKSDTTEVELRNKTSIPGVPLEHLRFIKNESGCWIPAGGTFDGWPEKLSELKALDPCCGSGHFLVSAFLMLVPMRMELEGLLAQEACDAVLRENIHGLEIDQRCVELAAFAVALTVWRYPGAGGYRQLPELQIACCGQSVNVKKEEWLALAEGDFDLKIHLEALYNLFQDAPVLGSLINPRNSFEEGSIFAKDWEKVRNVLQAKLDKKKNGDDDLAIVAQGMEKAFQLLGDKYHWVITNVPYLARGKQAIKLQDFCESNYKEAEKDLATVFLQRCLEYCYPKGNTSIVLPQNWLFLMSYKKYRELLLHDRKWWYIARLGEGGFNSAAAAGAFIVLLSMENARPNKDHSIKEYDVSEYRSPHEKMHKLQEEQVVLANQLQQLGNPDARITVSNISDKDLLSKYSDCFAGVLNGDSPKFQRKFWEITHYGELWTYQQTTVENDRIFGGLELVLFYDKKNGHLREDKFIRREKLHDSDQRGNRAWGKWGIGISQMRSLPVSLYTGETFDSNIAVILPKKQEFVLPIWLYCQSEEYYNEVRKIDKKVNVTNATLVKVPFDIAYWQKIANGKYPSGLQKPYSNDPTQWIFHGHPAYSEAPLQVAVIRLLGYQWPAELNKDLELSDESRELVKKCDELPYADKDGIACIPSVRGEAPAAVRLLNLLAVAYRGQDINSKLSELLATSDHTGKSLESWLRDKFFTQHCKLFGYRPFIWHIWDGLSDGFAALVNYHKLDRKNLETLIYTYLGDWISKQKAEIASGVDGAQEKLAAAENLKKNLELILLGENPYDIFVRWKPIDMQPIGWEPDINDGVRLNIRPFISVLDVGKKDAGVLRDKPNIQWDKDRGKDTASSSWFKEFNGDRINDWHLTIDEKKRARDEKR